MESKTKTVFRWILTVAIIGAGVLHFVIPDLYVAIMPPYLPAHLLLVYVSGVAEIAGGLGLILPSTRRAAAWGLIALFVAVFPANIHAALHPETMHAEAWQTWARLPLQGVFIAWAYWFAKKPRA